MKNKLLQTEHAILSPSSAHRWLMCTPSARLEEKYPRRTSVYAEEGILAHQYCADILEGHFGISENLELKKVYNHKLWHREWEALLTKEYISKILKLVNSRYGSVWIEYMLDMSSFIPEGFGTADAVFYDGNHGILHVIDLKFGRGIKVLSRDNPQLKLYGWGALKSLKLEGISTISTQIIQPRLNHFNQTTYSFNELLEWITDFVMPRANKAFIGQGEYKSGSHCQFCSAIHVCPEYV